MNGFNRRLAALERKTTPKVWKPWHRIIQQVGETRAEAIAKWEAQHGRPLGDDDCVIWRIIVEPKVEAGAEVGLHG